MCTTAITYNYNVFGGILILFYGQNIFFGKSLKVSISPLSKFRVAGNIVNDVSNRFTQFRPLCGK